MKYFYVTFLLLLLLVASEANLRGLSTKVVFNSKLLKIAVNNWLQNPKSATLKYGSHISDWDTSKVYDMSGLFQGAVDFNEDLSRWDVSNVRDFRRAFANASAFTSDLSNWDTRNAKYMKQMFHGASSFSSNLNWNTTNVLSFAYMFAEASSFNGNVSTFDINNAYDLSFMFYKTTSFDQDISGWTIEHETEGFRVKWAQNFASCFEGASSFTGQNITNWQTFSVTNMNSMFKDAVSFSGDVSGWNVANVKDFGEMFAGLTEHSQDLCWNIQEGANTTDMFDVTSDSQVIDCSEENQRIAPKERSILLTPSSAGERVNAGGGAATSCFVLLTVALLAFVA